MIKRIKVMKFDRLETGFEETLSYMAQTSQSTFLQHLKADVIKK
jgi:hypothetical protein